MSSCKQRQTSPNSSNVIPHYTTPILYNALVRHFYEVSLSEVLLYMYGLHQFLFELIRFGIHLSDCPYVRVCLSIFLSVCLFSRLFVGLSLCPYEYLSLQRLTPICTFTSSAVRRERYNCGGVGLKSTREGRRWKSDVCMLFV